MTEIKPIMTSPWASANRMKKDAKVDLDYPNLKGMEVMLINPDDYYRKKLFGLGSAYIHIEAAEPASICAPRNVPLRRANTGDRGRAASLPLVWKNRPFR